MSGVALHETIRANAATLSRALAAMKTEAFSPDETKVLRKFTAAEAAEFLGVTPGYLRKAHFESRIPEVEQGPGGKRLYSAEEIWRIRLDLAASAKNAAQFLPGRIGRPERKLQIYSLATFKGGAGKTTATASLGQHLALRGYRVLLVDFDGQASLTTYFGFSPELDFADAGSVYDAIRYRDPQSGEGPVPLRQVIRKTYFHNLDLAPGGLMLMEFEHETPRALSVAEQPPFFARLAQALHQVESDYDVVLIDCPPQLGYTTLAAICASTSVIVPVIPVLIDVASAAQFLQMSASLLEVLARSGGVTAYDHFRFLISRLDVQEAAQGQMVEFLRRLFGEQVMQSVILKSSAISEAALRRETIYDATRGDMTRQTYDRILASLKAVGGELEEMIQAAWRTD